MKRSCPKGKNIHTPNTYQRRGIAWAAIYLQVYFVCFNKTKAGAGARLVKACCVLAESQAAWKCQGNHTQHSEGSAHSWRREWSRGWEMDEKKQQGGKEREKPVKILHSKLRLSLAVAVSPAGHPSLSLSLSLSLSPFYLHGVWFQWKVWDPVSWRETQTKTDRYSNKSLVGWFL